MLQLTGDVDNRDALIESLEEERDALKNELERERKAQREGARAVAALRKQLTPLYQALQAVFGHIEAIGGRDDGGSVSAPTNARIEAWKKQLGPTCAKVIDTLLIHGEMSIEQIRVNAKMSPNTVYRCTAQLQRAGAVVKNGGRFSLKTV